MTQDVLTVVLDVATNIDQAVKGFARLQESIKKANKEVQAHNKLIGALNTKYASLNDAIKTANSSMGAMNNSVDTLRKKGSILKEFKARLLAISMSMLFFGMFINRFLGGIARGATNAYMEIQGRHGEFTIGVNRLAGAWEFLKFSIMDALAEAGVLDWIIDNIIKLVDWFSQLSPTTQKWLGIIGLVLLIFSGLLFVAGQFGLAILGIITLFSAFSVGALASIKVISLALLGAVAATALLFGSFILANSLMEEMGPSWKGYLSAWATLVVGLTAAFKILGVSIAASLGPIAVLASFIALLMLARTLTDNWSDAFKLAGLAIVRALQHIFTFLVVQMNPLLTLIDGIIAASNKFLGTNFDLLKPQVEGVVDSLIGGDAIQKQIEDLMMPKQLRKLAEEGQLEGDTFYSRAMLEQNPELAKTDAINYGASIRRLRELGADLPSNYVPSGASSIFTADDVMKQIGGVQPSDVSVSTLDEENRLKQEAKELQEYINNEFNVTIEGDVNGVEDLETKMKGFIEASEREKELIYSSTPDM